MILFLCYRVTWVDWKDTGCTLQKEKKRIVSKEDIDGELEYPGKKNKFNFIVNKNKKNANLFAKASNDFNTISIDYCIIMDRSQFEITIWRKEICLLIWSKYDRCDYHRVLDLIINIGKCFFRSNLIRSSRTKARVTLPNFYVIVRKRNYLFMYCDFIKKYYLVHSCL